MLLFLFASKHLSRLFDTSLLKYWVVCLDDWTDVYYDFLTMFIVDILLKTEFCFHLLNNEKLPFLFMSF